MKRIRSKLRGFCAAMLLNLLLIAVFDLVLYPACTAVKLPFHWWYGPIATSLILLPILLSEDKTHENRNDK